MKKLMAGLLSLLFMAVAGFSLAQDTTPTAGTSIVAPQGKSEIRGRFKLQRNRIQQGLKSGVLSKDQAAGLMEKLKSIMDQAKAFFLQNGKKSLTADQKAQINQLLDENSKVIYQAKHPGQSASGDTTTAAPNDANETN
jgi:hypothetical protein